MLGFHAHHFIPSSIWGGGCDHQVHCKEDNQNLPQLANAKGGVWRGLTPNLTPFHHSLVTPRVVFISRGGLYGETTEGFWDALSSETFKNDRDVSWQLKKGLRLTAFSPLCPYHPCQPRLATFYVMQLLPIGVLLHQIKHLLIENSVLLQSQSQRTNIVQVPLKPSLEELHHPISTFTPCLSHREAPNT